MQRLTYSGKRVAQMVPVLLLVTLAIFALGHLVPGDPARIILGFRATPQALARLRHQLGLDLPLPQQYLHFLGQLLHGNLGVSYVYRQGVATLIGAHMGVTILLAVLGTFVTLLITIPLAMLSAVKADRLADHVVRVLSMVLFAMPAFWLGIVLVLLLAVDLHLFPVQGTGQTPLDMADHLVLPVLTVAAGLIALILRPLRNRIQTVYASDFVDAARARGLSQQRILWRHVLPNALISTVTLVGLNIGGLLGGTVVVENVFGLPGLGQLLVSSVEARDYPVVQGLALFFALAVIIANLLADITYTLLDPRVSLE